MQHLSVGSTRCLDRLSAAVSPESKEEVERAQAAQTKARKEAMGLQAGASALRPGGRADACMVPASVRRPQPGHEGPWFLHD